MNITTRLSLFKDFKESLEKTKIILKEKLVDLETLYSSYKVSDYIICHVITQIALVDLMNSLNLKTEINLAFSLGKIAYAYADSLVNRFDAINMAISISLYFEKNYHDRSIKIISKDEIKEINRIISENLRSHFISSFPMEQIARYNFSSIDGEQEQIINYLSSIIHNYDECKDGLNVIEKYAVVEITITPQLDEFEINDKIEIIKINKNADFYHGILECLGKLFQLNFLINFQSIYSNIEYPVRRGTASVHSLIDWDHSHDYFVAPYTDFI